MHQWPRFSQDPRESHGGAIIHLVKYLKATREQGMTLEPKGSKIFKVYDNADFCGNWHHPTARNNLSNAKSQTGYVILYAGCPIIWCSKLQTQIKVYTTEAEYTALSQSIRDAIPMMQLLREMKENGFLMISNSPKFHCRSFQDNSRSLELARTPKMRPHIKHTNQVYYHFRDFLRNGTIKIFTIESANQIAKFFTKPLPQNGFLRHRKKFLRW